VGNVGRNQAGGRGTSGVLVVLSLLAVFTSAPSRAEVMLFRDGFVFLIPREVVAHLERYAPFGDWQQFPRFTRRIDTDGDGLDDFIAIALGARNGYGAQVRYRLRHAAVSHAEKLGDWYWAVITDATGKKVYEAFNR
jgi:hypothetical protein